ncbi:hypothetical protein BDZ97DRAFT_2075900 [Flammula alnicola]|nr:hypothetical protein BDZ97DRAFT_2075900 [Flammula alnicola]
MKSTAFSRFKQLPRSSLLADFLSRHDDPLRSGFITRLDRSPVAVKRVTFIKALALNVAILLFVLCVAMLSFIHDFNFMGTLPLRTKFVVWAIQSTVIASAIIILLRSTTIPFFFGECRLRIMYGFRPSEVIIRKPPAPTSTLNNNDRKSHSTEDQCMEQYWRTAIRAINPKFLYSNTSAILSLEYWTVEYSAVFDALRSISAGEIDEESLEFSIWKQNSEGVWTVCELWRMHEIMTDQQEVAVFKTFLAQSGKDGLLAIWEDMISHSSSSEITERSTSPKSYQAMVDQFAREGLDYETVWSQVSEKAWPS